MKNPIEQIAINKKIKLILSIFTIICLISCKNENEDIKLLKTYFKDCKKTSNTDSLFLASNNTNTEILRSYKRHLSLKNSSDTLKNKIFQEQEYENFTKQVKRGDKWNINLNNFENIFPEIDAKKNANILYVTKPVYTENKKYALIYSYNKKATDKIYFTPSIEVYEKQDKTWSRISTIKHHEIPTSPYLE